MSLLPLSVSSLRYNNTREKKMDEGDVPDRLLADSASTNDTTQAQVNLAFDGTVAESNEEQNHTEGAQGASEDKTEPPPSPQPQPPPSPQPQPSPKSATPPTTSTTSLPALADLPSRRHLRTDSQLSSSDASYTPASELGDDGGGGDGDEGEGCPASPLRNRGIEYSEAATLPIGCTSVEEKINEWNGQSEKRKSSKDSRGCDGCYCCCYFLRSNNKLPDHPTCVQRIKYSLTCPPHGKVGDVLLWVLLGMVGWGCLICIAGESALPGGNLFSLGVLYVAAVLCGKVSGGVGMPPLLGSLLVGIVSSSVPGVNQVGHNVDVFWSAVIRNLVLVIILIRAGLGLDPAALRKLSCVVLRLAFLPCCVEAVVAGFMAKLLLGLPWLWSFMLGFVVAAVSPAVVVPSLLKLAEDGYGVEAGIPTVVIAAASLDDVLAITGFSVMLGLVFAQGSLVWTLVKGPLEVVAGLVYGVVFGALCWVLPHPDRKDRPAFKFVVLFCLGALGMFGSHKVGLESSGPIAVLSLAFVTGLGWRRSDHIDPEVSTYYRVLWEALQPALFVLIGAEIDVGRIDVGTIGWGLLTLLICLSLRAATSFLVVMGAGFTLMERLFIAIAWLPKATVQAAIGSHALDYVRQHGNDAEDVFRGQQVVTIAVMVILVTAPIGAAAIKITGPKFLTRRQQQHTADSHA